MKEIKLVVVNENVFGYIDPDRPNVCQVLHGSILKGYSGNGWDSITLKSESTSWSCSNYRLANDDDFESFRINKEQYEKTGMLNEVYVWNKNNLK